MSTLLDNVENSIWHAFDFLALEADGSATKSKLKVRGINIRLLRLSATYLSRIATHLDETVMNCGLYCYTKFAEPGGHLKQEVIHLFPRLRPL